MKPDWKDAPEWAKYLAQDKNGGWFWYENRPIREAKTWEEKGQHTSPAFGRTTYWEQSLEQRP